MSNKIKYYSCFLLFLLLNSLSAMTLWKILQQILIFFSFSFTYNNFNFNKEKTKRLRIYSFWRDLRWSAILRLNNLFSIRDNRIIVKERWKGKRKRLSQKEWGKRSVVFLGARHRAPCNESARSASWGK